MPGPRGRRTVGGGRKGGRRRRAPRRLCNYLPRLLRMYCFSPPPFLSHCNFLHRENTMENISQAAPQSLLLTLTTQTWELIRKKEKERKKKKTIKQNTGSFFLFLFSPERFQRLKLRNPVMVERHITWPLNGLDTICPRCLEAQQVSRFLLAGGSGRGCLCHDVHL